MIDRALIKSTMGALLANLAQLPPAAVRWKDEAQGGVWTQSPALKLSLQPISGQGIDFETLTAHGSDDMTVMVEGQRRFTLSIQCESFEQNLSSPNHAANIADTLRIRLKRSSTIAAWRGICALETMQPTKRVDYKNNDRQVSCYVIDLMMRTADQDIDSSPDAGSWIGDAVIDGSIGPTDPPIAVHLDVDAR